MTLLFVVAVVLLSVRIAAVLLWVRQHHENRVPMGPEERKPKPDRQLMTLRIPPEDYLTKDNVSVRVDAVVCFRIVDPDGMPANAQNYNVAMSEVAQAALRSVIGKAEGDDLSSSRDQFAREGSRVMEVAQPGPQDAPPYGPRDANGNPQDAIRGLHGAAGADWTITRVDSSVDAPDTPSQRQREVPELEVDPALTNAIAVRRGTTKAVRDLTAGRRMSFVRLGGDHGSPVGAGDRDGKQGATSGSAMSASVPRPAGGPACLGGRGDAAYLRGWDDAVDWIGKGNQAQPPTWGDVAYMTGWNDASRAMAKAGLGAKTSAAAQAASSTT
jgi:hypothetical protein